jgi:2-polyprenyl-3-methyl-5-hydroxy-6-metoxy-1,4-benzoquinol methylase
MEKIREKEEANKRICKICGASEYNKEFKIKESMFGSKDEFVYFECSKCGCLQLGQIPRNIDNYYPSNYYSFKKRKSDSFIKKFFRRKRDKYACFKKDPIGKMISQKYPNQLFKALNKTDINHESRILDVGCGAGDSLQSLEEIGFQNLTGIDPYISEDIIEIENNLEIFKKTIHELSDNKKFDVIIFNHSFEHIPDQLETIFKISKLLSEEGVCLIRMPVKTDYVWNRFNINWVQIDAPRHFFIHTLKSFEVLFKDTNLVFQNIVFDSTEFQFWGSEQNEKGIALEANNSYAINPKRGIFTLEQIEEFKKMAIELNEIKQGDQAAFYLGKGKI